MSKRQKNLEPQALHLSTLAGLFESSRSVTRVLPIETTATFTQLQNHLKRIARNPDLTRELYDALQLLHDHTLMLGNTTLVKPTDHPLVTRVTPHIPKEKA